MSQEVVGSAVVVIRASTRGLRQQIRDGIRKGYEGTQKDAREAGQKAGAAWNRGFKSELDEGLKQAQDDSGKAGTKAGQAWSKGFTDQLKSALGGVETDSEGAGSKAGVAWGRGFKAGLKTTNMQTPIKDALDSTVASGAAGTAAGVAYAAAFKAASANIKPPTPDVPDIPTPKVRKVDPGTKSALKNTRSIHTIRIRVKDAALKVLRVSLTAVKTSLISIGILSVGAFAALGGAAAVGGLLGIIGYLSQISGLLLALPALANAGLAPIAALVIGFNGIGAALGAGGASAEQMAEAMAKLAPNAREFVQAVRSLGPAWSEVRLSVQNALFEDMGETITNLANVQLPVLKVGLTEVATAVNGVATELFQTFSTPEAASGLATMLASTRDMINEMRPGVGALAQSWMNLSLAGAPFLEALGRVFSENMEQFRAWTSDTDKMTGFIQRGTDAWLAFWEMSKAVGGVMRSIMGGEGAEAGGRMVARITEIANTFGAFLKTAEGLQALENYWGGVERAISALAGPISALVIGFGKLVSVLSDFAVNAAPGLETGLRGLGDGIESMRPGLQALGTAAGEIFAALGPLFRELGPVLSDTLVSLAPAVRDLSLAFIEVVRALMPLLPPLASVLAPTVSLLSKLVAENAGLFIVLAVALTKGAAIFAFVAKVIGILSTAFKVIKGVILAVRIAWALLGIAFAANPIGIIITAVIAAGVALWAFFTKTETGRKLWDKIWTGIKNAFTAVWEGVLKPAWEGMKVAWDWLVEGFKSAWENVLKPVWDGMVLAFKFVAAALLTWLITPALIAWNVMSAAFSFAWQNILKPTFDGIAAIATWLWTEVLQPAWEGMKISWQLLATGFQFVYNTFIRPVFDFFGMAAQWLWNSVLVPAFNGIKAAFNAVGTFFLWIYNTLLKPAFDAVGSAAMWLWNNVLVPAFNGIRAAFDAVGKFFQWVYDALIKPAFDAVGSVISFVIDNVAKPAFDRLKSALSAVGDFFRVTVDGIKTVWDRLKGYLATPINFMINSVWNGGIAKAWNTAREFLPGLPEAKTLAPIAFREGGTFDGRVSGPGTRTSDSILARLSRDEHVWDGMDVIKAGGHNALYAMRAMIEKGIPFTWDRAQILAERGRPEIAKLDASSRHSMGRSRDLGLPAFKRGGAVDNVEPAWVGQLIRGHEFAQTVAPAPYLLGGSSGGRPGGPTDCSGFMSEIADVILGGPGGTRKWATGSFPGPQAGAWTPGLGQGFSVGIVHGGPAGGHTAGTLSAAGNYSSVNVESGGGTGQGATYGGLAVGADHPQFSEQHSLKIGADGAFESAGGPSPEQQRSKILDKIAEIFSVMLDDVIDNAASIIGSPPPHWLGIPPTAGKEAKDEAIETLKGIVDDLGAQLRSVYDAARSLGEVVGQRVTRGAGAAFNAVGGLFRDQGGWIPDGLSIVRNETGAPEAVLNWDQLEMLKQMLADAGVNAEDLAAVKQVLSTSGLSMGDEADVATMMSLPPTDLGGIWAETMNAASISFLSELGDMIGLKKSAEKLIKPIDIVDDSGRRIVPGSDDALSVSATGGSGQYSADGGLTYGDPSMAVSAEKVTLKTQLPDISGEGSFKATGNSMDYIGVIKDMAEGMGLGRAGAKIGVATGLVESNIKILANRAVPESLNFPHDGLGGDHDSVGIFQQRQAGWGTLAQRMSADGSAKLFFDKLQTFNWRSMDPGAAAQKVQVSAFPLKYGQRMGEADSLLAKVYDTGGVWKSGTLGLNLSGADEMVLKERHWDIAEGALATVVNAGRETNAHGGSSSSTYNNPNQMAETVIFQGMDERKTFEEWDRYQRQNMNPVLSGRFRGGS